MSLREIINLNQAWKFCADEKKKGISKQWYQTGIEDGVEVRVPHTFNIMDDLETYCGDVWYEYNIHGSEDWKNKRVQIIFNGIYRDADFWINGEKVFEHYNSGYTTFGFEITKYIAYDKENKLVIKVNNEFSEKAIPIGASFDWANDGGIFREVKLLITNSSFIDTVKIDTEILDLNTGKRCGASDAKINAQITISQETQKQLSYSYSIEELDCYNQPVTIFESERMELCVNQTICNVTTVLENVKLWHFDFPKLYRLMTKLYLDNECIDEVETKFGVREFKAANGAFYLNGEAVRLVGTEWMPGSNSLYGNAEPRKTIEKTIQQLKECNCIFTRFHWQQDDAIYEWCDSHGMLVQEEIPNWGGGFEQTEWQLEVSKKQFDEMIKYHYNHPSIVSWGVANELKGQDEQTKKVLADLIAYCKSIDKTRMINYVTCTMWENPDADATRLGDTLWINDYIGTWHGDLDASVELDRVFGYDKNKVGVISEFGLCEPAFDGGDPRRIQIFEDKMDVYEKYEQIGAVIHFCLNDYRTQMGEEGSGKFRRRVHGSTDIYGVPKESYYVVQRRHAPISVIFNENVVRIQCKDSLPSYTVKDYKVLLKNKDNLVVSEVIIPTLLPGQSFDIVRPDAEVSCASVYRPNGDFVCNYETGI